MKKSIWQNSLLWGVVAFAIAAPIAFFITKYFMVFGLISGLIASALYLRKLANFNPNADAKTRINQPISEKYPVVRNLESEQPIVTLRKLECPICGNARSPEDFFCRKCGAPLQ